MCEFLGYEVKKLKRIRIMNIRLDLPIGKWRDLSIQELAALNNLLEDSQKQQINDKRALAELDASALLFCSYRIY